MVAPSYKEVRRHIRELERRAERMRREEVRKAIAELRRTIRRYGITAEQLFGDDLSSLARFRDPATGSTWNGFGRPPNWIRGKDRGRYRID
jgi:DNA-binding protein H-NS